MLDEKTADDKTKETALKAFGKGMAPWGTPFSIGRQRGLYYYVPAGHFDRLVELNTAAGKDGLPAINVVGRGGVSGNRPFALGDGLYVCVLAEHARRLREIGKSLVMPASRPAESERQQPETTIMDAPPAEKELTPSSAAKTPLIHEPQAIIKSVFVKQPREPAKSETVGAPPDLAGTMTTTTTTPAPPTTTTPVPPTTTAAAAAATATTAAATAAATAATTIMPPEPAEEEARYRRQSVLIPAATTAPKEPAGSDGKKRAPEGRYVYCIIKAADAKNKTGSFGKIGLGSEEVYCIDYKNVSAVVSDFDGADCKLSEDTARVHNEVISRVMERHGTVLPVGFGAVFASRKILKNVLGRTYHVLKEEMKGVENKVELGIKIVANKQSGETAGAAPEEALDILGKIAAKTHKARPFMDRMLLNASFLVERSRVDEFGRRVEELEKKYSDAVKIQYTGPWPPYNFVSVRIGAEGGGE